MPKYKCWIQIEEIPDDEHEDPQNVSEPFDVREFATQEEAENYVDSLLDEKELPDGVLIPVTAPLQLRETGVTLFSDDSEEGE